MFENTVSSFDDINSNALHASNNYQSYNLDKILKFEGSYQEFFINHLLPNHPCVIPNVAKNWNCFTSWVKNNKPDFTYLKSQYGHVEVPVAKCNEKYFNSQTKTTMSFQKYIEYWKNFIRNGYSETEPCLYLKDWHFMKDNHEELVYNVPQEFCSDWLNEYFALEPDDYRFVYMGPKGSWTPFHADVFTSYSWSVNICGEKKWILLPPGEEQKLKDNFGVLPYDINSLDYEDGSVKFFIVFQKAGDAIFVPSGWHHQVWNTMDTISINHNWINGCNIFNVWKSLKSNLFEVKREIDTFKDSMENWEEHCQLILKSCFGMDFSSFHKFIVRIYESRKKCAEKGQSLLLYNGWEISSQHIKYEFTTLQKMLETFNEDEDVKLFLNEKKVKFLTDLS